MERISCSRIEKDLVNVWNVSHPEMRISFYKDLSGCRILEQDTHNTLVYAETPGKLWDAWCYYAQGYRTAWSLRKEVLVKED